MTTPAPLYSCHNKPREAAPYLAQNGYYDAWERTGRTFTRAPRYVEVPHAMSTNCRYDRAHADSRCAGCRSKATGGMMNICKDCKNYDDVGFLCVRGKRQVGIDAIQGAPVFKYKTLEYVWNERGSIMPWRCGKKGRHFEPKVTA